MMGVVFCQPKQQILVPSRFRIAGMTLRILVIEDDADYRDALCQIFNLEGFTADGVGSLAGFLAWRSTHPLDVLIVDRQLPDGDGLEAVALHRQSSDSPVIVLTALGQLPERVAGMEADADYYLVKPVVMDELIALLRRLQRKQQLSESQYWTVSAGHCRLHSPDGVGIPLTRRELHIILMFHEQPGQILSRQELAVGMGEDPALYDPRRLEILIRRLRNKVEKLAGTELPLNTVYGLGFNFTQPLRQA